MIKKVYRILLAMLATFSLNIAAADLDDQDPPVPETMAIDFDNKTFTIDWDTTPDDCKNWGFKRNRREDDDNHFCLENGDMQYHFQHKDKKLAYCRITRRRLTKDTIPIIVNRNLSLLKKNGRAEDVDWDDLPIINKGGDYIECTYVIRDPDATMLFIGGGRGAWIVCEMRVFNPGIYPPRIKSITKKYKSMIED